MTTTATTRPTMWRLPGVYAPQGDTWVLADLLCEEVAARRAAGPAGPAVVDLCTGTGALAISAALAGAGPVHAVDISRRAALAARVNARRAGVAVQVHQGDVDRAPALVGGRRFDVVVSNPPYVPSTDDAQPRGAARAWDAGADGRLVLDRICVRAPELLAPSGALLLVHSEVSDVDRTLDALRGSGLQAAEVGRTEVPFGPVMRARHGELRDRGLLAEDAAAETLVLVRADAPADWNPTGR